MKTTPKSVIIRSTSGVFEPRFKSAFKFLNEMSADVSSITWSRTVREEQILDSFSPWVYKSRANYGVGFKNYFSHLKFMSHIYRSLNKINPNLVYACDLDTLIPSLIWGRKKTCLFIFDQFDPLSVKTNNFIVSKILDRLELVLSTKVNFRLTPNLNRISSSHTGEWTEIKNLFEIVNSETKLQKSSSKLQLFYGGVLSPDRGLMALSSAVIALPQWEFQIFGQGPELLRLQSFSHLRIINNGLLEHQQLMKEAGKADLYAALYDPRFNHNKQTASNKLFEAAQLGIPLLASKDTYLGEIVESNKLGWTVHYADIQEIIDVLANFGSMGYEEKAEIKRNLNEYFVKQLFIKQETLNRLLCEVKRALET
jgi:glycosyltransferase involved in cell wall biosynthesis